jgi:hypothetical protein
MTKSNYQEFRVDRYGVVVDAVVVDRDCPGTNSTIYVTYNHKRYDLPVSFSNCINDFPNGSIVKAKYLEGQNLQFNSYYSLTWVIVMETITLMVVIMSALYTYQAFFPKKAEEEN